VFLLSQEEGMYILSLKKIQVSVSLGEKKMTKNIIIRHTYLLLILQIALKHSLRYRNVIKFIPAGVHAWICTDPSVNCKSTINNEATDQMLLHPRSVGRI
jgi:hypothetical protein